MVSRCAHGSQCARSFREAGFPWQRFVEDEDLEGCAGQRYRCGTFAHGRADGQCRRRAESSPGRIRRSGGGIRNRKMKAIVPILKICSASTKISHASFVKRVATLSPDVRAEWCRVRSVLIEQTRRRQM